MKITEDIHLVKCPLQSIFTGVYVVLGDRISLFDAGMPASPESTIFPYLKSLGRDPSEISLVIASHGHDDHFGGIKAIKEKSGAIVAAHTDDAAYIEDPTKLWIDLNRRFPAYHLKPTADELSEGGKMGVKVDRLLEDGMIVDLGTFKARVVHAPGHTKGSICLYDEERKIIFTGDSVQGRGTVLQSGPLIYGELDEYLGSMERLKSLDPDTMLLDHEYLPMNSAVLGRVEALKILEESIKCVGEISKFILDKINSSHMAEFYYLVDEVKALHGANPASMSPCSIVDAVLKSLEKRQLIKRSGLDRWIRAP